MRVGITSDFGTAPLKDLVAQALREWGHEVVDLPALVPDPDADYVDSVVPLGIAVSQERVERGILLFDSAIGPSIVANKIRGVRAALIHDCLSVRRAVAEDNLNVMCISAGAVGPHLAVHLIRAFIDARFEDAEEAQRRLAKVALLEVDEERRRDSRE